MIKVRLNVERQTIYVGHDTNRGWDRGEGADLQLSPDDARRLIAQITFALSKIDEGRASDVEIVGEVRR